MLSKFDLFGIRIGLRYNQNEQYKSEFGAIVTLSIFALIFVQAYFVGRELIDKKNPDVIFSERYVASPEKYEMSEDKFNIAFGVQKGGSYEHFIDKSIYNVKAEQMVMKKVYNESKGQYEQDYTLLPIKLTPCSQESFKEPQTHEQFKNLPLVEQMYCLEQDGSSVYMEGDFSQDNFGYLKLTFTICDQTQNPLCKDLDFVQKQLLGSFVALYLNDIIINPKSQFPFEKVMKDFFWNTSSKIAKELTLNYRNVYVESDKGVLFEEKSYDREAALSNVNEQIVFDETSYFATIFVRFEKQKESVYYRKYKKIDSALAEIGGIAKALMIIGFFICVPFNRLHLHYQLACQLFSFNEERQDRIKTLNKSYSGKDSLFHRRENSKKLDEKFGSAKKQSSLSLPTDRNINISDNQAFNQQQPQTNHNLKSDKALQANDKRKNEKKNGLNFNWYEFVRYYFCSWGMFKQKKNQLDYAIEKIYSHLDMLTIIHKLVELERIKTLLFDENQIKLIQFLPKPNINKKNILNSKNSNQSGSPRKSKTISGKNLKQSKINLLTESMYIRNEDDTKQSKSAFLALKSIFAKRNMSQVDNKIIQMLDDSFLSCIDEHIQEPLKVEMNDLTFMKQTDKDEQNIQDVCESKAERHNSSQGDQDIPKEDNLSYQNSNAIRKLIIMKQQRFSSNEQQIYQSFPDKLCTSQIDIQNKQNHNTVFENDQQKISENVSESLSVSQSIVVPYQEENVLNFDDKYKRIYSGRTNYHIE